APFRDLAQGLAARGVATLRYDKYTLAHRDLLAADPARAASFTMQEEYVDDALAAFRALAEDARFSGTFLLGHSQGASAAPRVASELPEGSVRGIILLAGTPLSIADLMYRQNMDALAAMNLPAEQDAQVRAQLDAERAKQAAVGGMTEAELKSTYLYGALSGWYLKDEAEHAPAPLLKNMDVPLLVVQGGKDWQVKPDEGMDLWREALAENNAQFLTFPDMTHFLFDLEGPSAGSAADYLQPRPVSEALMDALAEWVLSLQVTVR
ncbi:MAG TPA: alpha/beta fold hydrolase, partial [Candidatus Limnocylindria bacterium]|nr:alpha/beta fold hydrolase [Candidatus Limnocylindria bacterium]